MEKNVEESNYVVKKELRCEAMVCFLMFSLGTNFSSILDYYHVWLEKIKLKCLMDKIAFC